MALQNLQDNEAGRNPPSPSRRDRCALERRQDWLLSHLHGVPMPDGFDPTTGLAILDEVGAMAVFIHTEKLPIALDILGWDAVQPEPEWWRPGRLTVLVRVDDWFSVAWLALTPMTKGGAA